LLTSIKGTHIRNLKDTGVSFHSSEQVEIENVQETVAEKYKKKSTINIVIPY
jgi:hypothetical protein